MLAEEGGGQADGESQLEGEGVDPWGQQDRYSSYIWSRRYNLVKRGEGRKRGGRRKKESGKKK